MAQGVCDSEGTSGRSFLALIRQRLARRVTQPCSSLLPSLYAKWKCLTTSASSGTSSSSRSRSDLTIQEARIDPSTRLHISRRPAQAVAAQHRRKTFHHLQQRRIWPFSLQVIKARGLDTSTPPAWQSNPKARAKVATDPCSGGRG